jgi:hypothetical protein
MYAPQSFPQSTDTRPEVAAAIRKDAVVPAPHPAASSWTRTRTPKARAPTRRWAVPAMRSRVRIRAEVRIDHPPQATFALAFLFDLTERSRPWRCPVR